MSDHRNNAVGGVAAPRLVGLSSSCVAIEQGEIKKSDAESKVCVAMLRACVILRCMDADTIKKLEAKLAADQDEISKNLEAIRRVKNLLGGIASNASPLESVETNEETANPASPAISEDGGRSSLGAVDDAVKWAVAELVDTVFDSSDIQNTLEAAGKHCNRSSVSAAMGRLRDKGILTVVEQGQGRRATRYKTA